MIDFDTLALAPAMTAFGEPATLLPKSGGAAVPFVGTFFSASRDEKIDRDGNLISTNHPALGTQLAQFAAVPAPLPRQGDQVLLASSGITYAIIDTKLDGIGGLHLMMQISKLAA